MTRRFNTLALLLGLVILSIALIPQATRAALQSSPVQASTHGHQMHDQSAGETAKMDHAGHAMARASGDGHGDHKDPQSCWEHCADLLATTVQIVSPRERDSLLNALSSVSTAHRASIADAAFSPSYPIGQCLAGEFCDHKTGVSGLVRTSMRLRN